MQHCDPEMLALVALGERGPDPSEQAHLNACGACRAELDVLTSTVVVARGAAWAVTQQGGVALQSPPDRVWTRVRQQVSGAEPPVALPQRRRGWLFVVAAAACVLALAGSFLLGRSVTQSTPGTAVAQASLDTLPGETTTGTGTAVLLQRDGSYAVQVDTQGLPSAQGFYEVWLLNPDDSGLVSLGTLSPNQGRAMFPVPDGLPLNSFTVVDVSDEPLDGNPNHSKVSVLRGQFAV